MLNVCTNNSYTTYKCFHMCVGSSYVSLTLNFSNRLLIYGHPVFKMLFFMVKLISTEGGYLPSVYASAESLFCTKVFSLLYKS
jgi:hypothetical protein